ncbi:hypothetical protein M408DRAFT_159170 [Serendipita vermifera MAFF 305830]|uniref:F-box domain-containing protein n=1 Tax=Serendipita vermifera MAFF 305830 TaxID=933852 RepID=A0A0C3B8I5_SERVB|nr:hypothetical protein M408DRAFT_159170 [Serendipita vermifera MAFF 305830]
MHSRQLESLDISMTVSNTQHNIHADEMLSDIGNIHSGSIRIVRLCDMTATGDTLLLLFSQCTRLQELSLRMNDWRSTLVAFTTLGSLAVNLECLNLTLGAGYQAPDASEIERFFEETMPRLRTLYLCKIAVLKSKLHYIGWERCWVYDDAVNAPRQVIVNIPPS